MPLASWADLSDPSESFKQPVSSFPSPRKASNNLFHHFRPLENLQTTCFIISEPSKTFKQPVSSNPSPRKPSNNLFHHFRALGASADAGEESRVHDARNEYAHQTGSRPEWTDAGYDHTPHTGAYEGGVCDTPLPYRPGASARHKKSRIHAENVSTCTRLSWLASLTPPAFLAGIPDAPDFIG